MAEREIEPGAGAAPDPLPQPPADYNPIAEEQVSSLPALLGMKLVVWREDFAAVSWEIGANVRNRQGVAHGGAVATLIDTTAGYAAVYCPYPGRYRAAFTLSLDLKFIAAARLDRGPIRAEARRVGGGASIAFIETEAWDGNGVLLARAGGVFRMRGDSRTLWGAPRA